MEDFAINLDWKRDMKGYVLEPAERRLLRKQRLLLPAASEGERIAIPERSQAIPERIVRGGGKLESIRPTAENRHLYLEFSQLRTAPDLLAFINRFGPLTEDVHGKFPGYEHVGNVLGYAEQMRDLIKAKANGSLGRDLSQGVILDLLGLTACLVADRLTGRITLQFTARSLLDALRFQLGRDLMSDTIRVCLECEMPFRAGIGTGRRADAKFCSDQHREAHKSHKRSQREA